MWLGDALGSEGLPWPGIGWQSETWTWTSSYATRTAVLGLANGNYAFETFELFFYFLKSPSFLVISRLGVLPLRETRYGRA